MPPPAMNRQRNPPTSTHAVPPIETASPAHRPKSTTAQTPPRMNESRALMLHSSDSAVAIDVLAQVGFEAFDERAEELPCVVHFALELADALFERV